MFCFKILFLNARTARTGRAAVVSCRAVDACSGPRSEWRVSVPGSRLTNEWLELEHSHRHRSDHFTSAESSTA